MSKSLRLPRLPHMPKLSGARVSLQPQGLPPLSARSVILGSYREGGTPKGQAGGYFLYYTLPIHHSNITDKGARGATPTAAGVFACPVCPVCPTCILAGLPLLGRHVSSAARLARPPLESSTCSCESFLTGATADDIPSSFMSMLSMTYDPLSRNELTRYPII